MHLSNRGEMVLGDRVTIRSHWRRSIFAIFPGGRLEIGDRTTLNYGADIAATKLVKVGNDCRIGTNAIIMDNDFHGVIDRHKFPEGRPVVIEDRVWIGNRVTILRGVTIGAGSVVSAGAVVTRTMPPHSLIAGNPARVVRNLGDAAGQMEK